ncbi:hypothetical protein JVT61DRAFT_11618 [Boletus reticuloceps]|uniref:Mid2 domain-containing protein n=1 Tax=Boletus reticuloceps TaxID=495285 RepID=A0A8I3AE86_9AGAM|nr:hypothetical protein JVT61DRAFT_11618 [Boletus reticuloceps]
MGSMWYITPLLLATVVLADYNIDNANTSVLYSMPPTLAGQGWQTFSVGNPQLALSITNSTGNYTIVLDPSHCYNQDYRGMHYRSKLLRPDTLCRVWYHNVCLQRRCVRHDGRFFHRRWYSYSQLDRRSPAPTFQVSNVSLYDIQGLPTGNHTMKMTLLDWNGGGTSMKFDYAHVNETFVALPVSTTTSASQTSSQTPTPTPANNSPTAKKVDVGGIVGATLGGLALVVVAVGIYHWRKRKATPKDDFNPDPTFQVNPFTSEVGNPIPPPAPYAHPNQFSSQYQERTDAVTRSAILRDALAGASANYSTPLLSQSSQSISSGPRSVAFQPLRRQPSYDADVDAHVRSSAANASPASSDPRYNLTAEQVEIIDRLRADNVPQETVMRVFEGFISPKLSAGETSDRRSTRARSFASAMPPPSYQTRDG